MKCAKSSQGGHQLRKIQLPVDLSAAITGSPAILMGNVSGRRDTTAWCAYVTSKTWNARILGRTKTAYVDRTSIVDMVTANGLQFTKEAAERVLPIRLDAERPDPENRTFPFDCEELALRRRERYLRAAMALVEALDGLWAEGNGG